MCLRVVVVVNCGFGVVRCCLIWIGLVVYDFVLLFDCRQFRALIVVCRGVCVRFDFVIDFYW